MQELLLKHLAADDGEGECGDDLCATEQHEHALEAQKVVVAERHTPLDAIVNGV